MTLAGERTRELASRYNHPSPVGAKLRNALSWVRSIFFFDPLIYLYTVVLGTMSLTSSLWDREGRVQPLEDGGGCAHEGCPSEREGGIEGTSVRRS